MKKILFFALAAMTLTFIACNKKDKNDPEDKDAKVFNATGELRGVMFPTYNDKQQAVVTFHPKANTIDVKFVQARITSTTETPQDIYIHNMKVNAGDVHIQLVLADGSSYASFPKSYAYAIMDTNQKTLNMHFGNDDESDTQVYFVFNATLEPEGQSSSSIKNMKFICDLDRGQTPVREYLYFGNADDFEWGMEIYEDQARTTMTRADGDYGTYVLNEEQQYIDMTFAGAFEITNGQRQTRPGGQAHIDGRWTYTFSGDTIIVTAQNGTSHKYWKK